MRVTIFLTVVTVLFACDRYTEPSSDNVYYASMESEAKMPEASSRKLIRHASLNFEVADISATQDSIRKLLKEFSAYASNESQSRESSGIEQNMEIRVAEKDFDKLVDQIEALAKKVNHRSVSVADVTSEFRDYEVRLKTKKELETRYYEILHQAKTVKDMLAIEEQLGIVREDIESMEAKLKSMDNKISYATLDITFSEIVMSDFGFGSKIFVAVKNGWTSLLNLVISLVAVWPLLLGGTAGFSLLTRYWNRRKSMKSVAS